MELNWLDNPGVLDNHAKAETKVKSGEVGRNIFSAVAVVMVATFLGRFLGFFREVFMAGNFTPAQVDVYVVGYTIPWLLGLGIAGTIAAAFIPIYSEQLLHQGQRAAGRLTSSVINLTVLAMGLLTIAIFFGAEQVVGMVAPGFSPERQQLAAKLLQIMVPSIVFVSVSGFFSGLANAHQHFLTPALAPAVTNVAVIGGIVLLGAHFGLIGVAVGFLAGSLGGMLIQWPFVRKTGYRHQFIVKMADPAVRKIWLLAVPVMIGSSIGYINVFIDRFLASNLPEGSIAYLNFGNTVMQLPLALFAVALVTPLFPLMSSISARKAWLEMSSVLNRGIGINTFLLTPLSVGMVLLAYPLIQVIYERGAFTPESTAATSVAFIYYSIGLMPIAIRDLLIKGFYAMQDTSTPVKVSLLTVVVNFGLSVLLVRLMGHGGIALATTLANSFSLLCLMVVLRRRLPDWRLSSLAVPVFKIFAATGVMAAVLLVLMRWITPLSFGVGLLGTLLYLAVIGAVGALIFGVMAWLLKVPEFEWLKDVTESGLGKFFR